MELGARTVRRRVARIGDDRDSQICPAVGCRGLHDVHLVYVDDELDPRAARWRVERIAAHSWHLKDVDGPEERRLTVSDDGRPILLDEVFWPLEI